MNIEFSPICLVMSPNTHIHALTQTCSQACTYPRACTHVHTHIPHAHRHAGARLCTLTHAHTDSFSSSAIGGTWTNWHSALDNTIYKFTVPGIDKIIWLSFLCGAFLLSVSPE